MGFKFGRWSVMEDAWKLKAQGCVLIQETGRSERPARMAGLMSLDSYPHGKDAARSDQGECRRSGA